MNCRKMFLPIILLCTVVNARTIPSPYEVGTWNGFRDAAITYTFDDGYSNQFTKAIPMFDQFGYKLTLFTVTEWVSDWTDLKKAASNGHEIASHTVTHSNLADINTTEQNNELRNSKETIESTITGPECLTVAYPYCIKSHDSITVKYYIAGRGGRGGIESSTPGSFMDINSIDCGNTEYSLNTLDDFNATFSNAAASKGWCVLVIHGIDDDGGYSPLSSTTLSGSLQYLDGLKSKYWITTFLDAARYIKERDSITIREISSQENSFTIQVTDNLPNSIYNVPITIRRPIPASWSTVFAEQNGKRLTSSITLVNSNRYISFDVVPDNGNVIIKPENVIPSTKYEIGTWNGFRSAAITYTFDDGCSNQFKKAIPIFDQYGYKMTLFTVIDWVSDWSKLINAAASGHEIASHTVSHPKLRNLSLAEQDKELKNSRNSINNRIPGQKCMTIAYPYCIKGEESITSKYYIAARGGDGVIESSTPASFMDIKSFDCGSERYALNTLGAFVKTFERTDAQKGWCVLMVHGIDNDGGYSPLSSTVLKSTIQYLNNNSNKYWVSAFSNTVRYIKERNNAVINEISAQGNTVIIQLTDNLPDSIYNYPITIRRPLPAAWQNASAEQNGKQLPISITNVNSVKYIMFDAVPDNGNIVIKQNDKQYSLGKSIAANSVNVNYQLTNSQLIMETGMFSGSPFDITIFDLKGAVVARHRVNNASSNTGSITLPFDGINRSSSMYVVRISNGEHVWSRQLLLKK